RACAAKSPWRARMPTTGADMGPAARPPAASLPAALGEELLGLELGGLEADHRAAKPAGGCRDPLGVRVVRRRLDDRLRAPLRILALEDARADEDALRAELHHQRRVSRRRDPAGAEEDDRELAALRDAADEIERGRQLLRRARQLGVVQRSQAADLAADLAHVRDRVDDVAGARLALAADHRGALADAPQRLAEIRRAAHERHLERPLVDVVGL